MADAAVKTQGRAGAKQPKVELTGAQKAAAVVVSLGAEKASLLYRFMEGEEVEQLTLEVARLGILDSELTEEILNEFYMMCLSNKAVTASVNCSHPFP